MHFHELGVRAMYSQSKKRASTPTRLTYSHVEQPVADAQVKLFIDVDRPGLLHLLVHVQRLVWQLPLDTLVESG